MIPISHIIYRAYNWRPIYQVVGICTYTLKCDDGRVFCAIHTICIVSNRIQPCVVITGRGSAWRLSVSGLKRRYFWVPGKHTTTTPSTARIFCAILVLLSIGIELPCQRDIKARALALDSASINRGGDNCSIVAVDHHTQWSLPSLCGLAIGKIVRSRSVVATVAVTEGYSVVGLEVGGSTRHRSDAWVKFHSWWYTELRRVCCCFVNNYWKLPAVVVTTTFVRLWLEPIESTSRARRLIHNYAWLRSNAKIVIRLCC